jgi:hypothetical protein
VFAVASGAPHSHRQLGTFSVPLEITRYIYEKSPKLSSLMSIRLQLSYLQRAFNWAAIVSA